MLPSDRRLPADEIRDTAASPLQNPAVFESKCRDHNATLAELKSLITAEHERHAAQIKEYTGQLDAMTEARNALIAAAPGHGCTASWARSLILKA